MGYLLRRPHLAQLRSTSTAANSLASCAAHFSASNSSTTLRCPAKPIFSRSSGEDANRSRATASSSTFPGATRSPDHTVFDQLRHSRYTGGDDGAAGRHRFHEHHRHTFGKARQAEHVGLCVVAAYVVLTDSSFEQDPVCYAEVLGATPKPFPERAVPNQDKPRLGSPVNDHLHRAQQNFQPFGWREPGDAEHHEAGAFSRRHQRIAAQVGTTVNHTQLCPVLGLGQVHQL